MYAAATRTGLDLTIPVEDIFKLHLGVDNVKTRVDVSSALGGRVRLRGGNAFKGQPSTWASGAWEESIPANPAVIGTNNLHPIWEVVAKVDPGLQAAVKLGVMNMIGELQPPNPNPDSVAPHQVGWGRHGSTGIFDTLCGFNDHKCLEKGGITGCYLLGDAHTCINQVVGFSEFQYDWPEGNYGAQRFACAGPAWCSAATNADPDSCTLGEGS